MRRYGEEVYGLSDREQQVVDRLEAGASQPHVATELGLAKSTVQLIAKRYIVGVKQINEFADSTRAGDARYRAALAACGGAYR